MHENVHKKAVNAPFRQSEKRKKKNIMEYSAAAGE